MVDKARVTIGLASTFYNHPNFTDLPQFEQ